MGFWRQEDDGVFDDPQPEPPAGPCPKGDDHDWRYSGHDARCAKCGDTYTF